MWVAHLNPIPPRPNLFLPVLAPAVGLCFLYLGLPLVVVHGILPWPGAPWAHFFTPRSVRRVELHLDAIAHSLSCSWRCWTDYPFSPCGLCTPRQYSGKVSFNALPR